jgi:aspartyl-tRNA(Asn)/glutamyl-tRNA(Gln) amidotransferase subunit A
VTLGAREMLAAFAARELSLTEAFEACVARIEERNGQLRAFVALDLDRAREEVLRRQRVWEGMRPGTAIPDTWPLFGVPVGVKDLFDTTDLETAYGSPMFAGRVPERDAAVVRRLRKAGAIVIGKTATHEFAWGITMRHARLEPTRNPFDPARTPGGSSGGSAVAVASGMVPLAVGTDTGGSIRLPAALCGVFGHKPTHGLVPLDGAWPLAPTFDHAGAIARTAADAALLLEVMSGRPAVAPERGVRFGFALPMEVAPPVEAALRAVASSVGAVEVELPDALPAYAPLFGREAVTTHREAGLWPARRDEYDATVAERMVLAEAVTDAEVQRAERQAVQVDQEMNRVFDRVELVLTPVCAWSPPPRLEEEADFRPAVTPLVCLQNLLGLPACAFPAGLDPEGMPIGLQLFGPRGRDSVVLGAVTGFLS